MRKGIYFLLLLCLTMTTLSFGNEVTEVESTKFHKNNFVNREEESIHSLNKLFEPDEKITLSEEIRELASAEKERIKEKEDELKKENNAKTLRILTIFPPIIAIILALVTKNVIISLLIGIFSGTFLLSLTEKGFNFLYTPFLSVQKITVIIVDSMADKWNSGILLQVLTIGGLIALISRMGGAKAIADSLSKRAKSSSSSQVVTWFLGLLVFFDDYANALIVGPTMRPITDKMKVSRERLAFIIDATAAPIAGLALISTWIGYEISVINEGLIETAFKGFSPYAIFVQTIPFRFYNIFMLIFVLVTSLSGRDFGPMLDAEVKAKKNTETIKENDLHDLEEHSTSMQIKEGVKPLMINALIPMLILVVGAFIGFYVNGYNTLINSSNISETFISNPFSMNTIREAFSNADASLVLFQSAFFATIVAIFLACVQKIMSIEESLDTFFHGMRPLISTCAILLLAWSLSSVIKEMGTNVYLAYYAKSIPSIILPAATFVLASAIAFATGTSYGTMGILIPLVIPIAAANSGAIDAFFLSTIGAVLTGATFGDHCSPISDTTIMSSMGAGCSLIDHVRTQLPYALLIGLVSIIFGYLPSGLGVSPVFTLPLGILITILVVFIFGKKSELLAKNK